MDRNEAIEVLVKMRYTYDLGAIGSKEDEALGMAIEALGKDTNVSSNSALDHIHNVVAENEYKRGYEQGKADAISMDWIKEYFAWLKGIGGGCGLSDARAIQSMIIKWKMEHPQSGCGPDSCKLGGEG